jgi:DNA primase
MMTLPMGVDLDEITRLPITEVAIRLGIRVGRDSKALCFSHREKSPSLSFNKAKNYWKCFGCDLKGGTIKLVMSYLGCDFKNALEWFKREFHVSARQGQARRYYRRKQESPVRPELGAQTQRMGSSQENPYSPDPELYEWLIGKCGDVSATVGLDYLRTHGISREVCTRFGIRELRNPPYALRRLVEHFGPIRVYRSGLARGEGANPKNLIWRSYAILFPFFISGSVGFLQGRVFAGRLRYMNPIGIPLPLYNLESIKRKPRGSVVHICEGVPDAVALEGQGKTAVAVLGASSFRPEWVDHFIRYDVVIIPHRDAPGEAFRVKLLKLFKSRGKAVRTVRVPLGKKDIAETIAEIRRNK